MKKSLTFLLAFLLVSSVVLPSCSSGEVSKVVDETTSPDSVIIDDTTSVETELRENLPDIKFDGYNFRAINVEPSTMVWLTTPITATEETADLINDALYRSTALVSEKYDFQMTEIIDGNYDNVSKKMKQSIQANADDYDIGLTRIVNAGTLALDNLLFDFNAIPNIDLTMPWWDNDMREQLSIGDKIYFMAGDMELTHYDSTLVLMFNKQLAADATLPDMYQLVRDNDWTFEQFKNLASRVVEDLNGDSKYDHNDRFGYVSLSFLMYPSFLLAADQHLVTKDADDLPTLNIGNTA